jgi:hypothetical protein
MPSVLLAQKWYSSQGPARVSGEGVMEESAGLANGCKAEYIRGMTRSKAGPAMTGYRPRYSTSLPMAAASYHRLNARAGSDLELDR